MKFFIKFKIISTKFYAQLFDDHKLLRRNSVWINFENLLIDILDVSA